MPTKFTSMSLSSIAAIAFTVCGVPCSAAIHAGDHLNIRVYNHPELSTVVTVDSHGLVQLPLAGTIRVAGMESSGVAEAVRRRVGPYIPYPDVDVQDTSESEILFVSGGPGGVLPYEPNETLSSAIAEIAKTPQVSDSAQSPPNGPLDRFDHSRLDLQRVFIYRSGKQLGPFNIVAMRTEGNPGPTLFANDTLAFANKPVKVTVNGAVNSPGQAYLWPDEPISDALAQAGGLAPAAASGHIQISGAEQADEQVALGDPVFSHSATSGETITVPTAPRVTVAGLVEHPGVVALQNDFTLVSALAAAGGYSKWGDLRKVQIVHQGENHEYNIVALAHGDMTQNPTLRDGDTVYVPEGKKTDWSQVFQGIGGLGGILYGTTHL